MFILPINAAKAQSSSVIGEWESLQALPFRPVHSILLPSGEVLMFASQSSGALVWDPNSGLLSAGPIFGYNPFCSGHVQTADSRVFFAGGQVGSLNSVGAPNASYYDPSTNLLSSVPDMNAGRWYPSLVAMGNGDVVVLSGDINVGLRNEVPEVWDAKDGAWRDLTGASQTLPRYPAAFLAPNGNVFVATSTSRYLDTEGAGAWTFVANQRDPGRDDYGSACILGDGQVLYTGGGDAPLASGEVIDLNSATPSWTYIADMPEPRRQHNMTLLPDGRVLVTGGSSSAGFNTDDGPKTAIVWDPVLDEWTTWAQEGEFRGYHSESLLLDDGRVVSIGGDGHPSLQVFSPPYLFGGPRPVIDSAPGALRYGDSIFVETADAADIASGGQVNWLRPGSVTHTKNMNQRFGRLDFIEVPGGLMVDVPDDPNVSPAGDYMLFLISSAGVPSLAEWVRLATQAPVPGLIESWQFDTDGSSGLGVNNAVLLNGAAITLDQERNNVLSCDGVDDLARINNTTTVAFTWSGWLRTSSASSSGSFAWEGDGIISSSVAGAGNDFVLSVLNNRLSFYAGETGESITGSTDLTDGQWHHVAIAADGNAVNLFVDGLLEASGAGLTAIPNANADIHFCGNPTSGHYFSGLIDEIEQYERALTGVEIAQLATAGGGTEPLTIGQIISPPVQAGSSTNYTAIASGGANHLYSWDFGDGTLVTPPSSNAEITYAYAEPGLYLASVVVTSATGETAIESFWQAVHATHTTNRAARSSSIVYEERSGGDRVWNANPDNDSVTVYDALFQNKVAEIAVGDSPRNLAIAPDGRVWITNKGTATVSVVDSSLKVVETLHLPNQSQPHGIVFDPDGVAAYIALEATGQVLKLDPLDGSQIGTVDVGPNIRHLAVNSSGSSLFVSRFVTLPIPNEASADPMTSGAGGQVLVVDTSSMQLVNTVTLQHSEADDGAGPHNHEEDEGGHSAARGIPNYLGAAAISPDGLSAWVPSKQDNIKRGLLRDNLHLTHDTTIRAVSSRIDLSNSAALATEDHPARVDHDNTAVPSAATHGYFGNYLFVALEGSRKVHVVDAYGGKSVATIDVGRAPQGVVLSPDGMTLYTHNFMDRSVSVHDVSSIVNENKSNPVLISINSTVSTEALVPDVLRGKQLFYDADDERLSLESYISCAGCHNDGGGDGRVWDFTGFGEGLRNTIDLRGKSGHGPLHWTGNFDEVQDFEHQIRDLAHGLGLLSEAQFNSPGIADPLDTPKSGLSVDLDALAAYVDSLRRSTPSPHRNPDRTLTSEAEAGKQLFLEAGCGSCHSGFRFTDSQLNLLHPVPSIKPSSGQRAGQPLTGLDTPSLKGSWSSGPYLHDGSAATLEDAIAAHVDPVPSTPDLASIASYLLQLDETETTLRIEAEAIGLSGFRRETVSTSSAGEVVNLKGAAN
ncbi:MAG: DUF1929 domain-containing protein, partial [Woeseia sp.]|nr:DUF1929 domain-containing protein [Woeseia sp.]